MRRKLRRTKFILYFLMTIILWQLYYFVNRVEHSFLHDRSLVMRHHQKAIKWAIGKQEASNFHFISFRERSSQKDTYNQAGGRKNYPHDRGGEDETLRRFYPGLQAEDSLPDLRENKTTEELRKRICKDLFLTHSNKNSYGACEPHTPSVDACSLAHALFLPNPSLSECKRNNETYEKKICFFENETASTKNEFKVKCDEQVCKRFVKEDKKSPRNSVTFAVYTTDPEDGLLKLLQSYTEISDLELQLPRIALLTAKSKFNFMFIRCFDARKNENLVSQLISVPPALSMSQDKSKVRAKNSINVNIVLLDSVSRAHFYRSLPKTVGKLRKLAANSINDPSATKVFDFELFQAVHGHTTHNEHALFTGQLLPDFDPEWDQPAVKAGILFGHFKRAGYQTMWQEDLCWTARWGLMKDLNAEDWEELQYRLRENYIDSTGEIFTSSWYLFCKVSMEGIASNLDNWSS